MSLLKSLVKLLPSLPSISCVCVRPIANIHIVVQHKSEIHPIFHHGWWCVYLPHDADGD